MDYAVLKQIHLLAVLLSISLFMVRGVWMLLESPRLGQRWVRIVPHVVDTVLLLSAIGMLVLMRLNPLLLDWLTAKLVALLVYIGLGMVALRYGRSKPIRMVAWLAAVATFAYIVAVAYTKQVLPL